jgi:hypothetical protein
MDHQDDGEARLHALHDLRGSDLVNALIKELGDLHRQVAQLQREMAAYRDYQAARDRWLVLDTVQKARLQLPRTVTIDASQSLYPRNGFHGLEYGARGVPFSWTGPAQAFSFDIFVDRTHGAELELRALSCINFDKQKDITLLANGEDVPVTVAKNGTGLVLNAVLPPRDDDRATNLVFRVPEVMKPPSPNDKRLLGIAFHSLSVQAKAAAQSAAAKPSADTVVTLARTGAAKRGEEPPSGKAADAAAS